MSFLNPSFLWALGALSIPVIIHLFNFRKTTRVYFSNNRFLKQVKESTTAKRKLKHYLILASRLLFLFFLIIAFCQPVIPAREQSVNHQNVVVYLDNSYSMSARMEDKTRGVETGIAFVNTILDIFPADARYRLVTNDFAPYSNSFKTKNEIRDLLAQIRISPVTRSMEEVINRIRQQTHARSPDIFYISDFQKSTSLTSPVLLDSTQRLHLVAIDYGALSNVFIDSVFLDNPFAAGGEKNVLRIKMRNDGKEDVDQLALKLIINSVQAGSSAITVPAGGVAETSFDLTTGLTGLNKGRITFNDFPVSFDNEFYVALNFTEKIKVLEIKPSPNATPIERVFGNSEVFSYRGFAVGNFNYSFLQQADLVVVNGLNSLDASLTMALRDYINQGGTLCFIPGTDPEIASFQNLLPVPGLTISNNRSMLDLDRPDFSNPFFENVFEEKSVSLVMPKAKGLLDWGVDRTAILRFKNEKAFLSRFDLGGKIYLLASPLDNAFTDFYNHALFVPVMYRMAASSKRNNNKLYYTLQESFIHLRIDSASQNEQFRLVNNEEIIPSQRSVGDRVLIDLPKFTMKEGFYNVVTADDTVNLLAFNLDKKESLLDQYNATEVKRLLGNDENITIFDADTSEAFSNEIKERYLGTPLWKYAVLLSLLFLAVEILLIRFMK